MTVSDNKVAAEKLGDFFRSASQTVAKKIIRGKKMTKTELKTGRAFELCEKTFDNLWLLYFL